MNWWLVPSYPRQQTQKSLISRLKLKIKLFGAPLKMYSQAHLNPNSRLCYKTIKWVLMTELHPFSIPLRGNYFQ